MSARRNQSGAVTNTGIAAPKNNEKVGRNLSGSRDELVLVIVVVMILGLLLTGRSGGG